MFHCRFPVLCGMWCSRNVTEEQMARRTRPQALWSGNQDNSNPDQGTWQKWRPCMTKCAKEPSCTHDKNMTNRSWQNRCQFRRENVKNHDKMLHDFCHAVMSVSGAHVSGPIVDLARIKDMTQNMLEGSDQEALSRQQGSETSGHGVAKAGPFENNLPDFQRWNFSEIKFLTNFVRLGRPRAKKTIFWRHQDK